MEAAHQSPYKATNPAPASLVGRFHVFSTLPSSVVLGHNLFVVSTSTSGTAGVAGKLADGTAFTFTGMLGLLNGDGKVPMFASIYTLRGSIQALFTIDGASRTVPLTNLNWVRPTAHTDLQFPAGFNLDLDASGSAYVPPPTIPKTRVIGLLAVSPNAQVTIQGDGVSTALVQNQFGNLPSQPTNHQADDLCIDWPRDRLLLLPKHFGADSHQSPHRRQQSLWPLRRRSWRGLHH
jgi:hypothetical protein